MKNDSNKPHSASSQILHSILITLEFSHCKPKLNQSNPACPCYKDRNVSTHLLHCLHCPPHGPCTTSSNFPRYINQLTLFYQLPKWGSAQQHVGDYQGLLHAEWAAEDFYLLQEIIASMTTAQNEKTTVRLQCCLKFH